MDAEETAGNDLKLPSADFIQLKCPIILTNGDLNLSKSYFFRYRLLSKRLSTEVVRDQVRATYCYYMVSYIDGTKIRNLNKCLCVELILN